MAGWGLGEGELEFGGGGGGVFCKGVRGWGGAGWDGGDEHFAPLEGWFGGFGGVEGGCGVDCDGLGGGWRGGCCLRCLEDVDWEGIEEFVGDDKGCLVLP